MEQGNNRGSQSFFTDFPASRYRQLQFAPPEEIETAQTKLFLSHLAYTLENSPFYREKFCEKGVYINQIKSLSDIKALPFTTKKDLSDTSRFYSADPKKIVDICLTSATSGPAPTMIPLTGADMARLAYNEEIALGMAGVDHTDTLLVCAALDRCFMAGLAYFLGGAKLSATVVRAGSGSPAQHLELIGLTKATVIVGVPSLIYKIGKYAMENNGDPAGYGINKLIAIGEPTKDEKMALLPIARELESMWGAKIFSTYASSEMAATFCECSARNGGHLRPELIVTEILKSNGTPAGPGEKGELVVTPLGVTGMPLIRFKTGDISYFVQGDCACGRTTPRLAPVLGRKNQMLKYKGTTLFPNAIISALEGDDRFHNGYVEAHKNPDGTDRVILFAGLTENNPASPPADPSWIRERLQSKLRVVPEIRYITPKAADDKVCQFKTKRKRITFFDQR